MNNMYIYNSLQAKYPELTYYINLVNERQRQKLYRESFLYMRLAEEYIVEILAKKHKLTLVEKNSSIPNMYSYRTIYSFSEELYEKHYLTIKEKQSHDNVRRYANAALHRGVDTKYLEQIWASCYQDLFFIASSLIDEIEIYNDNEMTVYTEGDFLRRLNEEFPNKINIDKDFMEATDIFLKRINLNILDVDKAKKVVDYYVQAIKGGTLPMLAVSYAIKLSQK